MKKTILILVSLLFLTGYEGEKGEPYLQDRNGIKYEVNSEVGFTGKYVEKYENGQKKVEINYKNGKKMELRLSGIKIERKYLKKTTRMES